MKKVFTLFLGLLLAVTLVVSVPTASFAVEEPQAPLSVDITSNRDSLFAFGIVSFDVTVTNVSQEAVDTVSAELLAGQLAPLGGNSVITAQSACLLPDESISFTFKATLNKEAVALTGLQSLGIDFIRLWYKNIPIVDNGFDDGRLHLDASKTVKFGSYTASADVCVWYSERGDVVSDDIATVVAFYNEHANAMKTCMSPVTVTKRDGTTSKVNYISGGSSVSDLAENILPNDYRQKPALTFVGGVSGTKTLAAYLPRFDSNLMSELNPSGTNGVKSATLAQGSGNHTVTIVMADDITTGTTAFMDKPTYVAKCMDTLNLDAADLVPFTIGDATATYTGCKIEAVFDAQNRMTKLDITTPIRMLVDLKYGAIQLNNTDILATYNGNYTFAY